MRNLLLLLLLISQSGLAQLDFLRFSTFYASYTTNTPQIGAPSFMVQGTEPDNPYDFVPNFVDGELVAVSYTHLTLPTKRIV